MPFPQKTAAVSGALAVTASAAVSGIGSYVLLIVVAKSVGQTDYADFAVFWSVVVTIGLGAYFPVEQETARDYSGNTHSERGSLPRIAFWFSISLTFVLTLLVLVLLAFPAGRDYLGSGGLVLALPVAFVGYLLQFPIRGLLSGARRTVAYASVISTEGLLRVVLPAVIALSGFAGPVPFALAVGVAAAVSVVPALLARDRTWLYGPNATFSAFSSRVARLIVAALTIQLLLNSGVLLARVVATSDAALAGQILTCMSIARIPVFAYQALQVLYMPRVAAAWKRSEVATARKIVAVATGTSVAVGVIAVVGMWLLGPWVIGLFFTPQLVLPTPLLVLLTAGVSLFLVAQVLSDGTLACGGHTAVVRSWAVALVAAVITAVVVQDPTLRSILPLVVGSAIAVLQFGVRLTSRLGTASSVAK